jgi:hypothetical protein
VYPRMPGPGKAYLRHPRIRLRPLTTHLFESIAAAANHGKAMVPLGPETARSGDYTLNRKSTTSGDRRSRMAYD